MLSWVSSSRASAPAFAPSRSTTARSATCPDLAQPVRDVDDRHAVAAQAATTSCSRAVSASVRLEVGSSMMSSRASSESAFAISTSCCCAIDRAAIGVSGGTVEAEPIEVGPHGRVHLPRGRSAGAAPSAVGSRPSRTLPATSRLSRRFSSWWMNAMPERRRRVDVADRDARAVEQDLARVGLLDARRRSSSAWTCRRRSRRAARRPLAGVHVEVTPAQRVHARETLLDAPKLEDRHAHDRRRGGASPAAECVSFVRKSSTLFCRMTIVGMNTWRLAGMPDRSPSRAFASSVIDW